MADYQKILITTDLSPQAYPAVVEGTRLARQLGSVVTLLYIVQDRLPPLLLATSEFHDEVLTLHRQHAEKALADYAHEHLAGAEHNILVRSGTPSKAIVETANDIKADLIIMASHGYGLAGQVLFGSTTEHVLHRATCPVMVVRSR